MANKKLTWVVTDERFEEYQESDPFHFYVSSLATWRTGRDLVALIEHIKRDEMPFNVYQVKLPESAPYKIKCYAPDLPDDQLVYLGTWHPE